MLLFRLDKFRSLKKQDPITEKGRPMSGGFFRILGGSAFWVLRPCKHFLQPLVIFCAV